MSSVHAGLAWSAVAGIACLVVGSFLVAIGAVRTKLWLDRAILLQGATAIVASIAGLILLLTGERLTDPLHFVYAFVLVAAASTARYVVRNESLRRVGWVMTLVSVIAAGVVIRAFMTGG